MPEVLLPPFTPDGLLPAGDFTMTIDQLHDSYLVQGPPRLGPGGVRHWDTMWRSQLVSNLGVLAEQLAAIGIPEVFVDGSFVADKPHPSDIDGYFVCTDEALASGRLESELNQLDPFGCWGWDPASRRRYRGLGKRQLPMWLHYRVELYPHVPGLLSGLTDEHGHELEFPAAFRRSRRDGRPRGVVRLITGVAA